MKKILLIVLALVLAWECHVTLLHAKSEIPPWRPGPTKNLVIYTINGLTPAYSIPDTYVFADTTARDSYFTSNPSELVAGRFVVITGTSTLQRYNGATWDDYSTLIQGPTGATGTNGSDGSDGVSAPWATSTGYVLYDIVANDGYLYTCTSPHTSDSTTEPGVGASWQTVWDLIGSGGSDSAAIHDNQANEINAITEKASPVSADLVIVEDSENSYAKRKVQVGNLPGGGGGITSVLGDSSGAVPYFFQTWTAFSTSDATPDVSAAQNFQTADTGTITGFDHGGGSIEDRDLYVYCATAQVFDITSSEITAINRSTDYTCDVGMVLHFKYHTNQWYALNMPDDYQTLATSGIVVNNSGVPVARSMGDGDGITWTNSDGTAGNPTPTVAYPFHFERTISDPADADDAPFFHAYAALTITNVACVAEGTTPSITVDIQECASDGSTSCATILSSVITCNGGFDTGTISDGGIASGNTTRLLLGAPSGTVDSVTVFVEGTR